MLRLPKRRRELLIDKLPDAANVALGALVFGQFLRDDPYSIVAVVIGAATWLGLMAVAWLVSEGRDGR